MDSWDSPPTITYSFQQQCRQLLGSFFRSLERSIPWFISIGNPVNGVGNTCLTHLLGFHHEVGVDFLCSIGLLRHGHSRSPNAITVVTSSWDTFIEEEKLGDIMETITKSTVSRKKCYFINYGKKRY
jgi:hypothetical protein